MAQAMVQPFAVEQWMDEYETKAQFNIAESCAASISLDDLQQLSDDKSNPLNNSSTKLTYGAIRGSNALRTNLANLYSSRASSQVGVENILITPGAIAANLNVLYALVGKGSHVVCHYPTYQQLYEVPRSLGAEVSLWKSNENDGWRLDLDDLKVLLRPDTKLIIIKYINPELLLLTANTPSNPQNPTGAIVPKATLEGLVAIAQERDITILSDEVYRPMFHSISPMEEDFPPSILQFSYAKAIATGSLSKAYSLAGIRVGWIASRSLELIDACVRARDYTTISVSQIDDQIAAYALSPNCVHSLLARNLGLARTNLGILESFIEQHRWACEWNKPVAGTTTFVKFNKMGNAVDDVAFCRKLMDDTGVMFCPGSRCFGGDRDLKGYVRVGFCCETQVLQEGLAKLAGFMKGEYKNLPLADGTS